MKRRFSAFLIIAAAVFQSACLVGPNYKRPALNVPPSYRTPTPNDTVANGTALAEAKWWTVFQDEQLQTLIRTALTQSFDLRIAATRVLQAEGQLGVTRADQFPSINFGGALNGQRSPQLGTFPAISYKIGGISLSSAWNLDFWGRYRRATESARASLRASEWGRRTIVNTVIANVANNYFQLRALDLQLEIATRTLASRQASLKLTQTLESGGATGLLDVRQAEQLVETAAAAIPDVERQIAQQENAISILLGNNPGPIARGRALVDQPLPPSIPVGLPSELLTRRPDIQQAEQQLVAANAQIGVAKAAYFPAISITGSGGYQTLALTSLISNATRNWTYAAQLTQPIFQAGRLRGNVRITEAQQKEALYTYQQTLQRAFSDVSNALIGYEKYRRFREHQEALVVAARDASNLSHTRYDGGVSSYLEVLTNETNLFSAELTLAQARLSERLSLVQVYNSLGGGWNL